MINKDIIKQLRKNPDLKQVEIISTSPDHLELTFKPGTQRTGKELIAVQNILFENKIFSFIKSEKVELWTGIIKKISISIY